MLNNYQICKYRDNEIVSLLQLHRYLTSYHFVQLLKWKVRPCNRRLQKLSSPKRRVINKWREHHTTNYIYYLENRQKDMKHWLLLADTYCYLKNEHGISHWENEIVFSMLRADAYCKDIHAFIEVDRSNNFFDKIPLYQLLFDSNEWIEDYSQVINDNYKFPAIIIVTNRKKSVEKRVKKDNTKGLRIYIWDSKTVQS